MSSKMEQVYKNPSASASALSMGSPPPSRLSKPDPSIHDTPGNGPPAGKRSPVSSSSIDWNPTQVQQPPKESKPKRVENPQAKQIAVVKRYLVCVSIDIVLRKFKFVKIL